MFKIVLLFLIQGQDACRGDSGGPLMVRNGKQGKMYLRGIVSAGSQKCGVKYPQIFTNVEYYIDWIKDKLKP